jgi:hypothetical protein
MPAASRLSASSPPISGVACRSSAAHGTGSPAAARSTGTASSQTAGFGTPEWTAAIAASGDSAITSRALASPVSRGSGLASGVVRLTGVRSTGPGARRRPDFARTRLASVRNRRTNGRASRRTSRKMP